MNRPNEGGEHDRNQASAWKPPTLPRRLLHWVLAPEDRVFALADLEEEFEQRAKRAGLPEARRWYWGQALSSVRPALARRLGWRSSSLAGINALGIGGLGQDVSLALRMALKTPVVTLIIIVSMGVGIGAVTTVSTLSTALISPPQVGFTDPEGLVAVYTADEARGPYGSVSFPDYRSIIEGVPAIQDAAAFALRRVTIGEGEGSRPLAAEIVTGNYFEVTGMATVLGRGFQASEAVPGAAQPLTVLSYHLWQQEYDGSPEVLGRELRVDGLLTTIIGVAPEGVTSRRLPTQPDLWIPVGIPLMDSEESMRLLEDRSARSFYVLGRLAQGQTLSTVAAQLDALAPRLDEPSATVQDPRRASQDPRRARSFTAVAERESRVNPRVRFLFAGLAAFALGIAGLVLFIACTNVTGLFVARAAARSQEMAVRRSLGAGRGALLRMLLIEGLFPGILGGALGLTIAKVALGALASISLPVGMPVRLPQGPDTFVLAISLVLAVVASLLYSLIPAMGISKTDLVSTLRQGGPGGTARTRFGLRGFLVTSQTAAAVILVVGAGVFAKSIRGAAHLDLGFTPEGLALTSKKIDTNLFDAEGISQYSRTLITRLAADPAIASAAISAGVETTLLAGNSIARLVRPQGVIPNAEQERDFGNSVTPGYLELMEVSILSGRTISEIDAPGAPLVAVINRTFAERFWPTRDPLGQSFQMEWSRPRHGDTTGEDRQKTYQVVGVAADGVYTDFGDPPEPYFWTAFYQDPTSDIAIVVRGRSGSAGVTGEAIAALREHVGRDPSEVPLVQPTTLVEQQSIQVLHLRIASTMLRWGGAFGLLLALSGIYGVVAYAVTRRSREMAIRIAIGANGSRVVKDVAWEGVRLGLGGLMLGLVVVLPLIHLASGVLYGVSPLDPLAVGGGSALVFLTALVASVVPATRIVNVAPMCTLREE